MPGEPDLTGKVALVTGASRGIGRAIAQRLAAAGATVVVTARSANTPVAGIRQGESHVIAGTLAETVALIREAGGKAVAVTADLESEQETCTLVDRAAKAGGGRLDILVNNAGFADFGKLSAMTLDTFDRTIAHYVRSPFILCQAAIPYMRENGAGWIVNIGSQDGLPPRRPYGTHDKFWGYHVYGAAKAAMHRLTQGMAAELEDDNIAVNMVGPSTAIRTPGASTFIPEDFPTEEVEYLVETVMAMVHLPAAQRTGLLGFSMHFPWHYEIEVRSLDGKRTLPRKAPPEWAHPAISASGE